MLRSLLRTYLLASGYTFSERDDGTEAWCGGTGTIIQPTGETP